MLLVYYCLYITYTLAGFLFDMDQSAIYIDMQKIEQLIRKCVPIPQKLYKQNKEAKNSITGSSAYFLGFLAFIDCT
jgi:hypothetical protein